jgi:four helix bundle protein
VCDTGTGIWLNLALSYQPSALSYRLNIAMGSASESEYQLLLARDLKFLNADEHQSLPGDAIEVKRMLASLAHKLRADR